MKHNNKLIHFLTIVLFVAPGCGRIIDWGKKTVDQGVDVNNDLSVARKHIQSMRVYDQFSLQGAFDVLWLSDDVREAYANLYTLRRGRGKSEQQLFLRRQLEENNHFISFYLLSVAGVVIEEETSPWKLFLKIGEEHYVPVEIKKVDLEPEYKMMFGDKFSRFKTAYIVRFNAKDIEDVQLIQKDVKMISLICRSVKKEATHSWNIDENGKMII